jgi:two-component system phosphate regulon sensor histidine kinase PhoR|tara:strand:+ start:957 stop:1853 length:897 start_codon:yes stop_codon:yes gene_type:complete
MKRTNQYLFLILLLYVILQAAWWLYSIYQLSAEVINEKEELDRKTSMIIGEGAVFLLILIVGFFLTYRSLRKEVQVSAQQKNFLLAITHELKTPIASIKLYIQTLIKRELEEEKRQDILRRCVKDADRLNGLVENILLATKIDDDSFPLTKENLNLSEMMESISLELLENSGRNVSVEFFIQPDVIFNGDKDAFTSIITNLVSNALKYSPDESTICVTLVQKDREVALSVSDEGVGVSRDETHKIFEKFFRSGNEETRKQKGTGLGLYIVKKMVNQHQGIIEVKRNKPKGSIFVASFR